MRKVLMISHGYPPVGGSGMLRTLKFSRYLPEHAWLPMVLTLNKTNHPRLDPRLLAQVPDGTAVYRSPVITPLGLLLWLRNLAGRLLGRAADDSAASAPDAATSSGAALPTDTAAPAANSAAADAAGEKKRGGLSGLVVDLLTTPDGYAGWYLPGLLSGLWAVIRHHPRVIYSTSPPPTAHLIGESLARLTGLPWVADFRDPWTQQRDRAEYGSRKVRWNRRLEARVVRRARRVICNTEPLAVALREAYPRVSPENFVVITNGFDPADFNEEADGRDPAGPFLFLHTGEFFPVGRLRVPDPFLDALRDLYEAGDLSPGSVKLLLIGSGEYTEMEPFRRLLASPFLAEAVETIDFLPHDEIPRQLAASDALLLFQNGESFRMQIPAKTFEYIRAGRPILAVSAAGATADLVGSLRGGRVVSPDDHEGLKRAILELLAGRGGVLERSPEELERFSRPGLTRELARVLDELAGARPAPREQSPEPIRDEKAGEN